MTVKLAKLSDTQVIILNGVRKRFTQRDIANKELHGQLSLRGVQLELDKLAEYGYAKNVRPGKALGWEVTALGIKYLKEKESLVKEKTNGQS